LEETAGTDTESMSASDTLTIVVDSLICGFFGSDSTLTDMRDADR